MIRRTSPWKLMGACTLLRQQWEWRGERDEEHPAAHNKTERKRSIAYAVADECSSVNCWHTSEAVRPARRALLAENRYVRPIVLGTSRSSFASDWIPRVPRY